MIILKRYTTEYINHHSEMNEKLISENNFDRQPSWYGSRSSGKIHWVWILGWWRGYSDVGDKVTLQWRWWQKLNDGDSFKILAVESVFSCWWLVQCKKSVTTISKLSPTYTVSNISHHHRCCRLTLGSWDSEVSELGTRTCILLGNLIK